MSQPLRGVLVADLTHALAGPFCTHLLQQLGADVVKVERPGVGDDFRHRPGSPPGQDPSFVSVNFGKRSLSLDMGTDAGQEVLAALAARADVLVENFRPGVTERLRIDAQALRRASPRLVYCSITGYGQTGPMRDWVAIDRAVAAVSGIGPVFSGAIDTFTGYTAFAAILAALYERERTGEGASLDIAMLDAAIVLNTVHVAEAQAARHRPDDGTRATAPIGGVGEFRAADRTLYVGAVLQPWFERVCAVLGKPELAGDERFRSPGERIRNRDQLQDLLVGAFAGRTAAEWEELLVARGVPAGVIRTAEEITEHPQVRQRQLMVDVPTGDGRVMPLAGSGLGSGPCAGGTVPSLGAHTDEVLAWLGYSQERIRELHDQEVL